MAEVRRIGLEVVVLWSFAASLVGLMLPAVDASERGSGHAGWPARRLVGWRRGHAEPSDAAVRGRM